ncbi:MAG: TIGR03862 family flavoprotein [Marinovum sp.]|nr:TIGR03862 family flavoprotein [Marinovum sp.]
MAANVLSARGHAVLVAEQKPSLARKFLMAGKTGLNLTKRQDFDAFLRAYSEGQEQLRPMLDAFGPEGVERWAEALGQEMYVGSTNRVFPRAWKASPLLRAWLARLSAQGVSLRTRWRWTGWQNGKAMFDNPDGSQGVVAQTTVLACGGGSWSRLGSDGLWTQTPELDGHCAAFQPSNIGLKVAWSEHMTEHFGKAIKAIRWTTSDGAQSRGEAILSVQGLEGGGIYPLIPHLRKGQALNMDLAPDLNVEKLSARLPKEPKGGLSRILRNTLRWPPEKIALFHECTKGMANSLDVPGLAETIKALPLRHQGPRPLDEAISTAGGLRFDALTPELALRDRPDVFACGEMLDWDAPTGGYLLTACLATGRWAGQHAAARLELNS